MLGELPPEPLSLYNRTVAGRTPRPARSTSTSRSATRLWLVVQENGSNVPGGDRAGVGAGGAGRAVRRGTPLSSLTPLDGAGLRAGSGPMRVPDANGDGVRVKNPSVLVYDIAGAASRGSAA